MAIALVGLLLIVSAVSLTPSGIAANGDIGGPTGDGPAPRLAVGGGSGSGVASDRTTAIGDVQAAYAPLMERRPATGTTFTAARLGVQGPFLEDGTLLKPIAVDTTVDDGRDLVRSYTVKSGDTLKGIAKQFGVSAMSVWWANKLKSMDDLHRGMILRIPPVDGLIVTVKSNETLAGIAATYDVEPAEILAFNRLEDPTLVVGQILIMPGAKGEPLPTPKPTPKPKPVATRSSSKSSTSTRAPRTYSGGNFAWPTTSHRISQPFHTGHYGIDIDGDTGDPIFAAAGGTVTFAGWKSNGGGYQVWIAHGSGLYTTYNHMSSVSVGRGQHVGRGQRVGRMGASGLATGSHLHFEVWRGPIWNGGTRVNPLGYL